MKVYGNYCKKTSYSVSGVMEFEVGVSDAGEDEVMAVVDGSTLTIVINNEVKYVTTQFNLIVKDLT